ncbi:MAG: pknB 29, partial [Planctomycetaceae bacterium]|nr:pknB 29 [Planctomycetaceae bacterium]
MTEEEIFLAILELANPADHAAYLDRTCGQDGELRRQVESLLAAHFKEGEFLDEPVSKRLTEGSAAPHTNPEADTMPSAKNPDEGPIGLSFLQPSS